MARKKKSRRFRIIDDPQKEFLNFKEEITNIAEDVKLWQLFLEGRYQEEKTISEAISEAKKLKKKQVDLPFKAEKNIPASKANLKKINKGKLKFDKVLDLHGSNLMEAERAINALVQEAYDKQKRLIKIITGKGKNSSGKLKKYAPDILNNAANRNKIITVTYAPANAGGDGVLYVIIKRKRPV